MRTSDPASPRSVQHPEVNRADRLLPWPAGNGVVNRSCRCWAELSHQAAQMKSSISSIRLSASW